MRSLIKTYGHLRFSALSLIAIMGLSVSSCKKLEAERLIILKEGSVSEVTYTGCKVSATLYDVGGEEGVEQHGFCYSLTSNQNDAVN